MSYERGMVCFIQSGRKYIAVRSLAHKNSKNNDPDCKIIKFCSRGHFVILEKMEEVCKNGKLSL